LHWEKSIAESNLFFNLGKGFERLTYNIKTKIEYFKILIDERLEKNIIYKYKCHIWFCQLLTNPLTNPTEIILIILINIIPYYGI